VGNFIPGFLGILSPGVTLIDCTGLNPGWETCFYFPTHVNIPNKVIVAATDHNDNKPGFSNFGNSVDLAAPGVSILSTMPGDAYGSLNGTSMASPHVAGAAALILAEFPEYDYQASLLRTRILDTVDVKPQLSGLVATSGRLNAFNSLNTPLPPLPLYINATDQLPSAFTLNDAHVNLCDVDGDIDLDVIISTGFRGFLLQQQNRLFINDGTGNFTDETFRLPVKVDNVVGCDCGDVDGDGDLDLVWASFTPPEATDRQNKLLINDGTGYFTDETATRMPAILDISRDADFVDVDDDADLDIYISNSTANGWSDRLLINDGTGVFSDESSVRLPPMEIGDTHNAEVADIDGDGDFDIYVANQFWFTSGDGVDMLLINDGNGVFTDEAVARGMLSIDDSSHDPALGDLDGDGDTDIVLARRAEEQNLIFINDGTGYFTNETITRLPAIDDTTSEVEIADVDGDLDLDVFFGNGDPNVFVAGQNFLLINDGNGFFTEQGANLGIPQGIVDTTKDVEFGDLDGDGDIDLYIANYGEVDFLLINTTF
jgi:hypothetical protein